MENLSEQNYCYIGKNKIYAEIYDELLDEELSMYNQEHDYKIKDYIKKKINSEKYISLSEKIVGTDDIVSDLILKITNEANMTDLQGNTILMFADSKQMYEMFYMENLVKSFEDTELNEFGSISNIQLQPVYWGCGVFKTTYSNGKLNTSIITKNDIANIFIQNYYHMGVMIGTNPDTNNWIDIEFTGEVPHKVIGQKFVQSNITEVVGFNLMPFVEENSTEQNSIATKLFGREMKGRVFVTLLCPSTQKKYWNIQSSDLKDILKVSENMELKEKINELLNDSSNVSKDQNPFYYLNKVLSK